MKNVRRRWTPREDQLIREYIKKYPYNIRQAIIKLQKEELSHRSMRAIHVRYYTTLKPKMESLHSKGKVFMIIGRGGLASPNCKNLPLEDERVIKTPKFWLYNLIKSIFVKEY